VILASPYAYGGSLGETVLWRAILSYFANGFIKVLLGIHGIHTMSSFFRLYKGSLIIKLQKRYGNRILERSGFESMVELLMKIIAVDATISEVPIELDTANRAGKSKMKVIKTGLGYLSLWKDKYRWMSD
jgi:dolichol-phosphate mannosyltransferase